MPTTNSDLFEMMGVAHLPTNSVSYAHSPHLTSLFFGLSFAPEAQWNWRTLPKLWHQLNVLKRSVKERPRLTQSPSGLYAKL